MVSLSNFCGEEPVGFIKLDISSNPNYIFKSDTSYIAKQLFDSQGNTVFVNSYIECVHYVSGGWEYTPIKNMEYILQDNLMYLVIVLLIASFLKRKIPFLSKK